MTRKKALQALATVAIGVLLMLAHPDGLDRYALRDFTLGERLLTQPRVVWRLTWTLTGVTGPS